MATPSAFASGLPLPPESSPEPTTLPSPSPSPTPAPVSLASRDVTLPLGHIARVGVVSPPSGILLLSVSDPTVASAAFNAIDRTIDVTGLHAGTCTVTAQDQFGQTASLAVTVQPYAGRSAASITCSSAP